MKVAQRLSVLFTRLEIPVGISVHAGVAYFGAMNTADGLMNISAAGEELKLAARRARVLERHAIDTEVAGSKLAWMAVNWSCVLWS